MGEAKRRKQLDDDWGKKNTIATNNFLITSSCVLAVYQEYIPNSEMSRYECFISPLFDVYRFNINKANNVFAWQNYFFLTNPDSQMIEDINPHRNKEGYDIWINNVHANAFRLYLDKKIAKDLVINPEWATKEFYSEATVNSFKYFKIKE